MSKSNEFEIQVRQIILDRKAQFEGLDCKFRDKQFGIESNRIYEDVNTSKSREFDIRFAIDILGCDNVLFLPIECKDMELDLALHADYEKPEEFKWPLFDTHDAEWYATIGVFRMYKIDNTNDDGYNKYIQCVHSARSWLKKSDRRPRKLIIPTFVVRQINVESGKINEALVPLDHEFPQMLVTTPEGLDNRLQKILGDRNFDSIKFHKGRVPPFTLNESFIDIYTLKQG